jgi:uncharacterized protein YciU (UPF0263 family)
MEREDNYKSELEPKDVLLETLDLSIRAVQALKQSGMTTLQDIIEQPEEYFTLENSIGFTKKTKDEIVDVLKKRGLSLKKIDQEKNIFPEELRKKTKDFYMEAYKEELTEGDLTESAMDKKVEGEESFYVKVITALENAKTENPDKVIAALFDIDETLVSARRTDSNQYEHILRPVAVNLLGVLKDKDIAVGFLTSRGFEALQNQLKNELKDLEPFINRDYIFSTRGVHVPMDKERLINESNSEHILANGDIQKMFALDELKEKSLYSKTVFVPIDDLMYPSLLPYGIALTDNEKFFL